jgi:hypothetical protein
MTIDSGASSQNASSGDASSELAPKTDGLPMEIAGFEPSSVTARSIEREGAAEDGWVFEQTTIEDGEEAEEIEDQPGPAPPSVHFSIVFLP